jgi:hypothetical protein
VNVSLAMGCYFVDILVARNCGVSFGFFLSEFDGLVDSSAVHSIRIVPLDIVDTKVELCM